MNSGRTDRRRECRFPVNDQAWLRVLDPLSMERIDATVIDVSRSGMKLRLHVPLHVGTTVQIHLPCAIALGEVRYCGASRDHFVSGILLSDVCPTDHRRDVRQEARYPVNVPGSLHCENSPMMTHEVTVLDVSKSGLRVRGCGAISQGTIVHVECSGATITGEVRYVRSVEDGTFNMGILARCLKSDGRPADTLDLTLVIYPDLAS